VIEYMDGDASVPVRPYDEANIIAHVANNMGAPHRVSC